MKRISIILTMVLLITVGTTYAQIEKGEFGIYGSISIPTGDFGDDKGIDAGGAKTGFGIGAEYKFPIGSPGLEWITSATFLLNGFDVSEVEKEFTGDIDACSWINVPVFTGLIFQIQTSPTLDIYGLGQVGLDFIKAPDVEISYMGVSGEISYDLATSFGFGIGGGLIINKKINIGFRYFGFGEPEIKGTMKIDSFEEDMEMEQPISIIMITIGTNF